MAAQKPRRLGRGLSSLIPTTEPVQVGVDSQTKTDHSTDEPVGQAQPGEGETGVRMIAVGGVTPSPYQPRREFDPEALESLAESIRRSGLMQPIIVRPRGGGHELVAGERRWRAAALAGLERVPALVRELNDEEAAEWALVENLQRSELNPMERAHGLRSLSERFGVSQADLGKRVGLERSTVANLMRLTELEEELQALVSSGELSPGHAKALLALPPGRERMELAARAVSGKWSVRQLEAEVRRGAERVLAQTRQAPNSGISQREAVIADLERRLSAHLGTKTKVQMRGKGNRGRVQIEFYSLEEFEGLMERLGLHDEEV